MFQMIGVQTEEDGDDEIGSGVALVQHLAQKRTLVSRQIQETTAKTGVPDRVNHLVEMPAEILPLSKLKTRLLSLSVTMVVLAMGILPLEILIRIHTQGAVKTIQSNQQNQTQTSSQKNNAPHVGQHPLRLKLLGMP